LQSKLRSGLGILGFLLLWQLAAVYHFSGTFLPPPTEVLGGFRELILNGDLFVYSGYSLFRILSGWLLGSLIAIPIGLLVGTFIIVRDIVDPFIHFFRFVPAIALITLFIIWFGVGELSKILLITYATGFIVMINTATGVEAISEEKENAARCLGASSFQLFIKVTIPATLPYIYTGMRLAMASSFLVIVAAEMLAADNGLGYLVWSARIYFRIDWLFAGIITLGFLGFATDRLWRLFGKFVLNRYLQKMGEY